MEINGELFIKIDNNNILHNFTNKNGCSGSPIILLLRNFKVIDKKKKKKKKKNKK